MIDFFSEDVPLPEIDFDQAALNIERILEDYGFDYDFINITFCSDEYLLKVNQEQLQHDYYTDIITFDYTESEGDPISADMIISVDRLRENAQQAGVAFHHELHRILFHGTLHLSGLEDASPEQRAQMTEKENYYLQFFSIPQ